MAVVLGCLALAWLCGTFTGSGLPALLGEAEGRGSCGQATGCWWELLRGEGPTRAARLARTAGAFGISLAIGGSGLGARDRRLLQLALGLTVVGDLFLVLIPGAMPGAGPASFLVGVCAFLAAHLALIARHGAGLRASLRRPEGARARWYGGLALLWAAAAAAVLGWARPLMAALPGHLFWIFLLYVAVLAAGVWAGTTAWLRPAFSPRRGPALTANAALIGVGVVCLGVTDLAVGVEHLYRRSGEGAGCAAIITVLKDLCYTPALMALACSGFVWFGADTRPLGAQGRA